MSIAEEASRLYTNNDDEALFRLAAATWPPEGQALPEGIGEVCRFASIRAVQLKQPDQYLWRARALTSAVLTGARDTAAGLLLQPYFVATSVALESGAGDGHAQARLILDEMKRLVPEDTPAWGALFARLYHEKRAFSFLMEGTGGGRSADRSRDLLRTAEAEYTLALQLTHDDPRGTLKVRGGLALARYLQLADDPHPPSMAQQRDETVSIHSAADAAGFRDVAGWAATNADVMGRGEFTGWTAYEVV
jgi:hypothetical protein